MSQNSYSGRSTEPYLLYVFDPLCGWCYGFSPVIQRLWLETRDAIRWEIMTGGMIVGDRVGPVGKMAGFLKQASKRVEESTGVRFGTAFTDDVLHDGSMLLSSEEPSRAILVARRMNPDRILCFAGSVQSALYREGKDLSDPETYRPILLDHGMDFDQFYSLWDSEAIKHDILEEFSEVAAIGIRGFPTLVGVNDSQALMLSHGWSPFETLKPRVETWMSSAQIEV